MRRTRFVAAVAALSLLSFGTSAQERCRCHDGNDGGEVLNGRLDTSGFDGGVGDRFGDGGGYGGAYVMAYGGGFAGGAAGASATAAAYASTRASTRIISGGRHGGWSAHGSWSAHGGSGSGHH